MGRRGGWGVRAVLLLALLGTSCGGTGGGPSGSGKPIVFQVRGRLALAVQTTSDPIKLILTATLLDPQGVPFRNEVLSFTADFPDATFIPGDDNQGAVTTNDSGQASITLIAGHTIGNMRVVVEAPVRLNISSGITVPLTAQGFVTIGPLGIIPTLVTFVNPAPHPPGGPADITFQAVGGNPSYKFSNSNPSVGSIVTQGTFGQFGAYSLTGPLPAPDNQEEARQDTITVLDAAGNQTTANVQVLFVSCALRLSADTVTFGGARGGESFDITIIDGVPPYTATHTFPASGDITINQQTGTVTFTIATPPFAVDPDNILIRDSRNCVGTVDVTITPAPAQQVTTILLTANPDRINGIPGRTSTITATVLDQDNLPIRGVEVLFTEENAKATIDPLTATTDASGKATTRLTVPPLTPTGVITVTGAARDVEGTVDVTIFTTATGPGGPPTKIFVDLFTDRSGDNNDGTCITILSALVVDALGNPVADGTRVDWAASRTPLGAVVSVTSPSFTNEGADSLCNIAPYEDATGLEIIPQPGDALACLKYPRSAGGETTTVAATAGGSATDAFDVILPPCPFVVSDLTIVPADVTMATGADNVFVIVGGVPPYTIVANGGTADITTVQISGGSFTYTAGGTTGKFSVIVTDAASNVVQAEVTIE